MRRQTDSSPKREKHARATFNKSSVSALCDPPQVEGVAVCATCLLMRVSAKPSRCQIESPYSSPWPHSQ